MGNSKVQKAKASKPGFSKFKLPRDKFEAFALDVLRELLKSPDACFDKVEAIIVQEKLERKVLFMRAHGKSIKAIASALHVSDRRVSAILKSACVK